MKFRLGRRKPKDVGAVLRGWRAYLHLLMLGGALAAQAAPARADLPVPCGGGSCGGQVWVASGRVQVPVVNGGTMRITQESDKAILNWASFNIGQGQQVQFAQPSSSAVALNRIHQADPSRIDGQLTANGQIYLINQNGIVFGSGAQVNVNALTASTLDVDDKVFTDTGLARVLQVQGDAAFKAKGTMGAIRIEQGAELKSADGGRIMIFAPVIDNAGKIETPDGQTVLAAAKDKVYLATSDDPNLRGLLVEVAGGGDLTNSGSVSAAHGNVSMLGFAINQNGVVSASTSVRVNGSIRLLAREVTGVDMQGSTPVLRTRSEWDGVSSKVTFGADSVTEVLPDLADKTTAVDEQTQQRSTVEVTAKQIRLGENALIHAPSGKVTLTATNSPDQPATTAKARNDSRIELAPGSRIDVAGTTSTVLPMERNQIQVELRANELRDSPLQRDGVLRGKKVTVDVRKGTPLADISGAVANIQRDIGERSSTGGDVNLTSEGDLIVRQGAVVDVSGGTARYQDGYIDTTKLLAQGKLIDIAAADPNIRYDAVLGQYSRKDPKWGVTQNWTLPGIQSSGVFEAGYVEGAAAGTISLKSSALRLDGELRAGVQTGPYQRDLAHLPAGGGLTVDLVNLGRPGLAYPAATVRFGIGPALTADEAQRGLDPSDTLLLSPQMLEHSGLTALTLKSAGIVDLPAAAALRLPAGGTLAISSSDVRLNGAIDIPAGTVAVNGDSVLMSESGRIDVSGRWVNDNPLLSDGPPGDPLLIDGGVVKLSARGDLLLRAGSVIDAGGGAWADSKGRLHGGNGGAIALKTDFPGGSKLELGAELRAYAPGKGGVLDITANSLRIDQPGVPRPSQPDPNELVLTPDFFQRGGFRSYRLNANLNSITVAGGTDIAPRMQNLEFDRDYALQPSDSDLHHFSHVVMLPDDQRAPVDISLSLQRTAAAGVNPGRFEMEEGSVIRTDPGAVVTLASDASLIVNGIIEAPAGQIKLTVTQPAGNNEPGYLAGQGIWLGARAQLLATSQLRLFPDDQGLRRGELLPGGDIVLETDRGFIVTAAGSVIDVSGGEAQLDVESVPGEPAPASLAPSRKRVIASAGSVSLMAAEGMLLDGDLRGHAPADAAAGTLQIELTTSNRGEPDVSPSAPARDFLYGPRRIEIRADGVPAIPAGLDQGGAIADTYNGRALLDARLIDQGGFDYLLLSSRNVFKPGANTPAATSEILFGDGVDLHLARGLVVDAPAVRGTGDVRLSAPYVTLGNSDFSSQEGATPSAGTATLQVDAAQAMEIVGALGLRGFGAVQLNSGGDLRLRGLKVGGNTDELTGALDANGTLTLKADQIYPSTLSQYRIEVAGSGSRLITLHGDGTDTPVLSAGSELTLHAFHIDHRGVLKAPLGTIHLEADDDVRLAPGSIVSVSAENQVIPFGITQFGIDWLYSLGDQNLLFGATADPKQNRQALPEKRIELTGRAVNVEAGATMDVSGGGDLLAYEFIPGPGGSRDVLAAANAGSSFAILPRLNNALAPYDFMASAGFNANAGATVHLTGGAGVPSGDYTILPARYALLPGAYLVTPVAGAQDIQPGMPVTRADNTPIVAGYYAVAGTGIRDSGRWQGYVVESADIVRQRSEYQISQAGKFFTGTSDAAVRLPQDAGRVQIQTVDSLLLDGQLRAVGNGGRGSALDISAADISIVAAPDAAHHTSVQISAASLNQMGAESLLIGGRRAADGTTIEVDAGAVRIAEGAQLQGSEILLAAKQRVTLEAGAEIDASGERTAGTGPLQVSGDGALLRAASGTQRELLRTGTLNGQAVLDIQAGARVTGDGSLLLDSSGDARLDGSIAMKGGSLAIGAAHINLGDAPQGQPGVVLRQSLLDGLNVDELDLRSSDGIDIYGNLSVNAQRLMFDAAGLYGHDNANASVSLKAAEIQFGNGHHAVAPVLNATSNAHLLIDSPRLLLNGGDFALQGYGQTEIKAARELYFSGDGHTQIDGDFQLNVGVISAAAGAASNVNTQGALQIDVLAGGGNLTAPGLGARLEFDARKIDYRGQIVLPSGEVTMNGRDGVTLAAGSLIDVSGTLREFADQQIAAPAGRIALGSAQGDIVLATGARLAMNAAAGGDAGELKLSAPAGVVQLAGEIAAHAAPEQRGGSVTIDVEHLDDFSALNRTLDQAGFSNGRSLRVRAGDMQVAAADVVNAEDVALIADGGGIDVQGAVISDGGKGQVALYARDDVTLGTGALLRAAGGNVELGTVQGRISLKNGALIDVAAQDGSAAGNVRLRAPRLDTNGDGADDEVAVDAINATITGAAQLTVEAFRRYTADTGLDISVYQNDTASYMAHAPAMETRLGVGAQVLPGVELVSNGNLTLLSDWDLTPWRYGNRPGVLTLRAAGNLYIGADLSDGFDLGAGVDARSGESVDALRSDASWSYRLVGGADLAGAAPLATREAGDVTLGADVRVRTGTGAIDVAAGRDFVLADVGSALYTAGVSTGIGTFPADYLAYLMPGEYPIHGGDVRIAAGGDVRGALPTQFITDWLHRMGGSGTGTGDIPTTWAIDFERYHMGIGAMGGGDVAVTAGGAVTDLAVMLPTTGQQRGDVHVDASGNLRYSDNTVLIQGGGDLAIDAGGDIRGGVFYLGRGQGEIRSGGALSLDSAHTLYPLLAMADGKYEVTSRGELNLESVVNPTMLRQGLEQDTQGTELNSSFFSYGADSGVTLTSLAGDVHLRNNAASALSESSMRSLAMAATDNNTAWTVTVYPGTLRARALQGNVEVNNSFTLFPTAHGTLELLAHGDVSSAESVTVNLSDADPALLPSISRPSASLQDALQRLSATGDAAKIHAATPVHLQDDEPVRIVAALGSVFGDPTKQFALYLSKFTRVSAGTDVRDVSLNIQNLHPGDVSLVQAAEDIRYNTGRNDKGQLANKDAHIQVSGPGRVDVMAGRDIDLGTSDGIVTIGNGLNPALPAGGADVVVQTGAPLDASYDGFINRYLMNNVGYRNLLADYMQTRKTDPAVSDLDAFLALPSERQRALIMNIFFQELQESGRKAANSNDSADYQRGYDAIATLYPPGESHGDLRMYFSRIHTVNGGRIYAGVPAGMIDAGVAAAVGITKTQDQLGIVALQNGSVDVYVDKDMLVNQSRVFAMDGGDILIWSSHGNIDAGRGAKTTLAAPSSKTDYDQNGNAITTFPPTVSGSGIRAFVSTQGRAPGNVDLFAPVGIVNAGDAGIGSAGNVTIGAVQVLGADNIDVGGVAVGVPVGDTNALGGALSSLGDAVGSATKNVEEAAKAAGEQRTNTPMADAALRFLEVEVTGFGADEKSDQKKDEDENKKNNKTSG